MKIIIFGLGNFGASLAVNLTETGNEVIGVDNNMDKINLIKDRIAHSICMDATNELAYNNLPVKETDIVVIAIGENEGAAIITTAIVKKLSTAKIIGRSLSPIHDTVLMAMGIDTIVHPEQESAERLTKKLNVKSMVENFDLDKNYSVSEITALPEMIGKSLFDLSFRNKYDLTIVTILRKRQRNTLIGTKTMVNESIGLPNKDTVIQEGDILVVFGSNPDIKRFCKINK
ncbi:TrkA family potassium uptake protein [Galbibacter sp. EGI 63066]|uniref:potassium channel family protein n=1 Tax=Galbibacter sp. EGI 63066 TaxID=2993559 RepID=UPI002249A12C|nr:TrkA family potassium uptake protein [Galbibacter sp. EGI 63066]MCX2681256.1 TrkA family potassium uptake protein [Galbibacter sp. EGI 63066]